MLTVKVSRRRWLRGTKENKDTLFSKLLQPERDGKKMCCLGFAARAGGIAASAIRDVGTPAGVADSSWPKALSGLISKRNHYPENSRVCSSLMGANDNHKSTRVEKEARIRELGRKIGLRFVFVP